MRKEESKNGEGLGGLGRVEVERQKIDLFTKKIKYSYTLFRQPYTSTASCIMIK